jgi:hypothetical protein
MAPGKQRFVLKSNADATWEEDTLQIREESYQELPSIKKSSHDLPFFEELITQNEPNLDELLLRPQGNIDGRMNQRKISQLSINTEVQAPPNTESQRRAQVKRHHRSAYSPYTLPDTSSTALRDHTQSPIFSGSNMSSSFMSGLITSDVTPVSSASELQQHRSSRSDNVADNYEFGPGWTASITTASMYNADQVE